MEQITCIDPALFYVVIRNKNIHTDISENSNIRESDSQKNRNQFPEEEDPEWEHILFKKNNLCKNNTVNQIKEMVRREMFGSEFNQFQIIGLVLKILICRLKASNISYN